jgi:hypothetical protein
MLVSTGSTASRSGILLLARRVEHTCCFRALLPHTSLATVHRIDTKLRLALFSSAASVSLLGLFDATRTQSSITYLSPKPQMAQLDKPLTEKLEPQEQLVLIDRFWRTDTLLENIRHYESYLAYYRSETLLLKKGILTKPRVIDTMAFRSHEKLLEMVELLSRHRTSTLATIRTSIETHFSRHPPCFPLTDLDVNRSIDFALRAWLMLNVRESDLRLQTPNTPTIQWTRNGKSNCLPKSRSPP